MATGQHHTADWYRALLAGSPDATALLARDGRVLFVTAPIERMTGYAPDELVGASAFELVHPHDLSSVREAFQRAVEGTEPVRIAYRARHRDGSWRRRDVVAVNRLADPLLDAVVVNYRDTPGGSVAEAALLERQRWTAEQLRAVVSVAEAALVERERATAEQLRAVISAVPIVLWAIDGDGTVTLSEGSLLRDIGLAPGQVVGQSIFDLYANAPAVLDYTRAALRGESPRWTLDIHGRTFSGCYTPLRDAGGRITGAIGVATDVSERVQLEQRLVQTHKMEAIGRLAGGIAHDFNNYLTAIVGYAELAIAQVRDDESLQRDLEEIRKAGHSAASLTHQLLAFSRKQLLQAQVLDLNAIVSRMAGLLRRLIGEHIELRSRAADALGRVSADPGQIEQVILNLALNARDAMPDGGTLTIETANIELDQEFAADHPGSRAGPHVMLAISDTGTGMDRGVQEHLFEPFYTTKEQGRGTGLGLATVYGIVKQSGGSIFVYSEMNRGTSFKIFLPRLEQAGDVAAPAADAVHLDGHETILVVEDQPDVRSVVHHALSRHGYCVLMATNGSEAVRIATAHDDRIDLLITDVVMPGLSARELAERFREQHPGGRVLYMSGYTDDTVVQRGILEHSVEFMQKPFTPAVLLRRVREVLDSSVKRDLKA